MLISSIVGPFVVQEHVVALLGNFREVILELESSRDDDLFLHFQPHGISLDSSSTKLSNSLGLMTPTTKSVSQILSLKISKVSRRDP